MAAKFSASAVEKCFHDGNSDAKMSRRLVFWSLEIKCLNYRKTIGSFLTMMFDFEVK